MADYIDLELRPLAAKLRARYPDVRIVWAHYSTNGKNEKQQTIRYQAPLMVLIEHGLVTHAMLGGDGSGIYPIGDGFHLCRNGLDAESRPGCCDLSVFTGMTPRERHRFSVKDAARLLKKIAKQQTRTGKQ
jgi:hypothetical protein